MSDTADNGFRLQSDDTTLSPSDLPASLGTFRDFELLAEVGADGPFRLYRARQARLNRNVTLKIPAPGRNDEQLAWMLMRESEETSRLEHPGIIRALELGELNDIPYLALTAVEGDTLADRIRQGPITDKQAAQWARQLAEILFHAHRVDLHHRNLRPDYVYVTADGQIRLTGFGTADRPVEMTGFLPPERSPGVTRRVDARADVYGIGALLYAMLTGSPPFSASDLHLLSQKVRYSEPEPPRQIRAGISRDLEAICLKCLARDVSQRYRGEDPMKPLLADLLRFLSGRPVQARGSVWRRPATWLRGNARSLVAGGLILAGIAAPVTWDDWRTANAWKALSSRRQEFVWQTLTPMAVSADSGVPLTILKDASILAGGEPAEKDSYHIEAPIPDGLRGIRGLRIEALPDPSLPFDGPGRAEESGNFMLTDCRIELGQPDAAREVKLTRAKADFSQQNFSAFAAIDAQPEATAWAVSPEIGKPHELSMMTEERVAVVPGESARIILQFSGVDRRHEIGRFRLSVLEDQGPHDEPAQTAAMGRFERLAELYPHDDAIRVGLLLTRFRRGQTGEVLDGLFLRDPVGLQIGVVDPQWRRPLQQIGAMAALHEGGYHSVKSIIDDDQRLPRTELTTELESLASDGDVLAKSIDNLDADAVQASKQLLATPELVRALLARRVQCPPARHPHSGWAAAFLQSDKPERFQFAAQAALEALESIVPVGWADHLGSQRAIPQLIVQRTSPQAEIRDLAGVMLNQIDPKWAGRPEARSTIPVLVMRTAEWEQSTLTAGVATAAKDVLAAIDPDWRRAAETQAAIARLMTLIAQRDGGIDPASIDDLEASSPLRSQEAPGSAAEVLCNLGEPVRRHHPMLIEMLASDRVATRSAALMVLVRTTPDWTKQPWATPALARLRQDLSLSRPEDWKAASRIVPRIKDHPDSNTLQRELILLLPEPSVIATLESLNPEWEESQAARDSLPALRDRLRSDRPEASMAAAWTLTTLGALSAPAVPDLIGKLTSTTTSESVPSLVSQWLSPDRPSPAASAWATLNHIDSGWTGSASAREALPGLVQWIANSCRQGPAGDDAQLAVQTKLRGAVDRIDPEWRTRDFAKESLSWLVDRAREDADYGRDPTREVLVWFGKGPLANAASNGLIGSWQKFHGWSRPPMLSALEVIGPLPDQQSFLISELVAFELSREARDSMIRLLEAADPRWRTSTNAASELDRWAKEFGSAEKPRQFAILDVLSRIGPPASRVALEILQSCDDDPDPYLRRQCVKCLGDIGPSTDHLPILSKWLAASDDRQGGEAFHADVVKLWGRVDPMWRDSAILRDRVQEWIADHATSRDENVFDRRMALLDAFQQIGPAIDPEVDSLVLSDLRDTDPRIREKALKCLKEIGVGAQHLPEMIRMLVEGEPAAEVERRRAVAAELLPRIDPDWRRHPEVPSLVKTWASEFADAPPHQKVVLLAALTQVGPSAKSELDRLLPQAVADVACCRVALDWLAASDPQTSQIPMLMSCLAEGNVSLEWKHLHEDALSQLDRVDPAWRESAEARQQLLDWQRQFVTANELRQLALLKGLTALGVSSQPAAVPVASVALSSQHIGVRRLCLNWILGLKPEPELRPLLVTQLGKANDNSSSRFHDDAVRMLDRLDAQWRTSGDVKREVYRWAAAIGAPDNPDRLPALEAIREVGPSAAVAVDALQTCLRTTESTPVQLLALRAVRAIGPGAAGTTPEIIAILGREPVDNRSFEALLALQAIGRSDRAMPALLDALRFKDAKFRLRVIETLDSLAPEWPREEETQGRLAGWLETWEKGSPQERAAIAGPLALATDRREEIVNAIIEEAVKPTAVYDWLVSRAIVGPTTPDAVDFWTRQLSKGEPGFLMAPWALGRLGSAAGSATPRLLDFVIKPYDETLRDDAWQALERIDRHWESSEVVRDTLARWQATLPHEESEMHRAILQRAIERVQVRLRAE